MEDHKKIENRTCPNCYYPMSNKDTEYCSNCGQKYKTGRVTFWELISEAFSLLFNFDNKFFHTVGAIFIPGRLTKQFFKGKHKSYVHPVRVLLVSTLVMIFALNHNIDFNMNSGPADIYDGLKKEEWHRQKSLELDTLKNEVLKDFNQNTQVAKALDSLVTRAHLDELGEDSIRINKENIGFLIEDMVIAREDIFNLSDKEIVEKYKVENTFQQIVWQQTIRVMKRGDRLLPFLLGNILWLVVIMMPLFALVLRIFYIRRDFYYVEHLVFAMHAHSFAFMLLSLYTFYSQSVTGLTIGIVFMLTGVYVILSMKRFYAQTWTKTVGKFFIINLFYWMVFMGVLVITLLLSLALF